MALTYPDAQSPNGKTVAAPPAPYSWMNCGGGFAAVPVTMH